jgi:hypothetical protein
MIRLKTLFSPQRRTGEILRNHHKNGDVSERVMALYGQPGFETWERIAKVLRVPRGTAWSLAHGLMNAPSARTLEQLALAEWRLHQFPQAVNNLRGLIGSTETLPKVFTRAQAGRLTK